MSGKNDMHQNTDQNAGDGGNINSYRRQFMASVVGISGVAAVATIAPGIILQQAQAKPADETVTNKVRWGLLIDINKLNDGGDACVEACKKEHGWGDEKLSNKEQDAQWIRKVKVTEKMTGHVTNLPVMCQHCDTAPCVDVCPTGASMKRADGIVLVNKHICIGCRYCMMACPYKARSFVHETLIDQRPHSPRGKGVVEACNMCVHRVDAGQKPACVEAAPEAILFGDLNDKESDISKALKQFGGTQIRADLGLNTGVRYWGI